MSYYFVFEAIIIFFAALMPAHKAHSFIKINSGKSCPYTERRAYSFFASVIIALFMGLRNNFAQDYNNYASMFQYTAKLSFIDVLITKTHVEKGYLLLCKLVSLFSNNTCVFMCVAAFIFVFLVMLEAINESDNMFFYAFFFVNIGIYFHTFNLMRQGLAASILYYGTKYLRSKSFRKYIFIVLLASTVHTSSLAMLAIFPFMLREVNRKTALEIIFICIISFFFLPYIISFVQIFRYSNYTYGMDGSKNINAVIVQWSVFAFGVFVKLKGLGNPDSDNERIIINGSIFFIIFSILNFRVNNMSRLCYFFSPYLMAFGANAVENVSRIEKRLGFALKFLIVILCIAYIYKSFHDEAFALYKFYWE